LWFAVLSVFLLFISCMMSAGSGWCLDVMLPLGMCFLSAFKTAVVSFLVRLCSLSCVVMWLSM
jgi:hypothetical protein